MKNNKLSHRVLQSSITSVLAALLCIVIGMAVGFLVLLAINPAHAWGDGFVRILKGGFYDAPYGVGKMLANAAPLVMTGLSVGFAFKTGLFNIGAAGQYTLGAYGALYCAIMLKLPWFVCLLVAAILGGAKVADKLNVISNLLEKVDTLIIGGGMAYTFLKAQGYEIGKSLVDDSKIDYCKEMMAKAQEKGVKLLLPVDAACVADFPDPIDAPVEVKIVPVTAIPADMEGCDIGPESMKLFADAVKASKTVVWNGPMGVFENPTLAAGTLAVAKAMAESGATTVIGGGDSAAAVQQMGLGDKMTHISTGGGASLEYLEGKELPGIAVIQNA